MFGYHVTGSTGTLFLYGIVVGAVGLSGSALLLQPAPGAPLPARPNRPADLTESRRETADALPGSGPPRRTQRNMVAADPDTARTRHRTVSIAVAGPPGTRLARNSAMRFDWGTPPPWRRHADGAPALEPRWRSAAAAARRIRSPQEREKHRHEHREEASASRPKPPRAQPRKTVGKALGK
ncbi:hypothetical protein R1X32_11930 [Rhodococcus opacus]|uniref:hypothetical protein n=1 Tax=Rhodococcus opacus TaxID=37919 RepID=UPI0034D2376C